MVFTADTDLTHNNVRFNILELMIKDINYKIISGRPFLDWMKGFQHPAAGSLGLYNYTNIVSDVTVAGAGAAEIS